MHYYLFNVGDFLKDCSHLSLEEEAIYRRLIDQYYITEKPIALDFTAVARSIRARGSEEIIELILKEFFSETPKGFKQKRIEADIKKYKDKSKKASESAKARWNKDSSDSEKDAFALKPDNEGNANQEPRTKNQEPRTKNQNKNIPYQLIADHYNQFFAIPTGNPKAEKISNKRKNLIKAVWLYSIDNEKESENTNQPEYFKRYFEYCAQVPFFHSTTPRDEKHKNWCPNLDFILRADTHQDIREGKYKKG